MHNNWLVKIAAIRTKVGSQNTRRTINQLLLLGAITPGFWLPLAYADTATADSSAFEWSFSLISEFIDNLDGGIDRGSATDHLAHLELFIDTAKLGLPTGSRLKATLQAVRSDKVSEDLVGDTQGLTNAEAPSRDGLYELWYGQKLGDAWDIRAGLIPVDNYFNVVDSSALLINSSFGAEPVWSGNVVAPIYPTAGIGAMVTWQQGAWTDRVGIFQEDPNDRSSAFKRGDTLIQELVYQGTGIYKLGLSMSHHHGPDSLDLPPSSFDCYFSIDEPLTQSDSAPHAFFRVGLSPEHHDAVRNDMETGLLLPGLIDSRPDDLFSVGIARADLRGMGSETAYEITYQYEVSSHLTLQPDIQYIDRPSNNYPAATVAILRLNISI